MAVAEPSFSTSIEPTSPVLISAIDPLNGMPSMTIRGDELAEIERCPRTVMFSVGSAPAVLFETLTPGIEPCSACTRLTFGLSCSRSVGTLTTAPVISLRFCAP